MAKFRKFRIEFKSGSNLETGRMGVTEQEAVRSVIMAYSAATMIIVLDPPDVLCSMWIEEYQHSDWPFCGHCGQMKKEHPVLDGTDEGAMAKQFMTFHVDHSGGIIQ